MSLPNPDEPNRTRPYSAVGIYRALCCIVNPGLSATIDTSIKIMSLKVSVILHHHDSNQGPSAYWADILPLHHGLAPIYRSGPLCKYSLQHLKQASHFMHSSYSLPPFLYALK